MIIDAHTHIFPDQVAKKAVPELIKNANGHVTPHTDATLKGLLDSMKESGIDYSIVLPIATNPLHGKGILKWLKEVGNQTKRILFYGSVHPYDPDFKEIIQNLKDEGVQGIKMHPQYQSFPVDDEKVFPIYEEIFKQDMVVHFHAGFDIGFPDSDFASAKRFQNFLSRFQGIKTVLAHGGGYRDWKSVLFLLSDFENVYFDLAFVLEAILEGEEEGVRELFQKKEDFFLFGTDSPWKSQLEYKNLVSESDYFTVHQKEKLFHQNILKLITLP